MEFFHKDSTKKFGLRPKCKKCRKTEKRYYYALNKNKILKYQKEYSQTEKGKEVSRKSNKKYKQTDKGKIVDKKYQQSENTKKQRKDINYLKKEGKQLKKITALKRHGKEGQNTIKITEIR